MTKHDFARPHHQNDRAARLASTYIVSLPRTAVLPNITVLQYETYSINVLMEFRLSPSLLPSLAEVPPPSISMLLPPEAMYNSKEELYTKIQAFVAQYRYAFRIRRSTKIDSVVGQDVHISPGRIFFFPFPLEFCRLTKFGMPLQGIYIIE